MSWNPIDTAPKDGTEVLTYDARTNHISVRRWGEDEEGAMSWQPRIRGVFPTHWMPRDELALPQGDGE